MAAPYGNRNAEKWSFRKSVKLFHDGIKLTNKRAKVNLNGNIINGYEFDFIGEIAAELGTFKQIFDHLTKRFPSLQRLNNQLYTNIERNCYYNGKRGVIKEGSAIMNLKSNFKWTDRIEENQNVKINQNIDFSS